MREQAGFDMILLDLDGTLIDSEKGIVNSVIYALEKFGIEKEREELLPFIGPPLVHSFREYTGLGEEEAVQAVSYYRENFGVKGVYEYCLFDGVTDLLKRLKQAGKTVVMATSKPEVYAKMIAEDAGITCWFDAICGSDMEGRRLTKEAVIEYALDLFHRKAGDPSVIMVGDRHYDIDGAKANGLASAGVLYGFGSREELEDAGADQIFDTAEELGEYLAGSNKE